MKRIVTACILLVTIAMGLNAQNSLLTKFPEVPEKQPLNSVEMGNWKTFPKMKLDILIAPGPFEPTRESIKKNYPSEPE